MVTRLKVNSLTPEVIAALGGAGGASITVANTAPLNPNNGALWFDSDTTALSLYYVGANTSFWLEIGGSQGPQGPDSNISKSLAMTYLLN